MKKLILSLLVVSFLLPVSAKANTNQCIENVLVTMFQDNYETIQLYNSVISDEKLKTQAASFCGWSKEDIKGFMDAMGSYSAIEETSAKLNQDHIQVEKDLIAKAESILKKHDKAQYTNLIVFISDYIKEYESYDLRSLDFLSKIKKDLSI